METVMVEDERYVLLGTPGNTFPSLGRRSGFYETGLFVSNEVYFRERGPKESWDESVSGRRNVKSSHYVQEQSHQKFEVTLV